MFKPLRFDPILKAIPGLSHLRLTPQAAHHAKKRVHVDEEIDVERVEETEKGIKETHVRENIHKDVSVEKKRGRTTTEVHERITEDVRVKKVERDDDDKPSETLMHVHATMIDVTRVEMTPPHDPREDTPIYQRTHNHLIFKLDTPCAICGVRHSTIDDPKENPYGAKALETHHYPIERSLLNACDPRKVHHIFPQVKDYDSLEEFIDSEENMMVLCDIHHRHPNYGIHHVLAQDFFVQPFLYGGYQVVADEEEVEKVMKSNERIMKRHDHSDDD
ncbi:hypothetical protein [Ktedonospora formicarum]|uniref:Uncharacterized protein n=1 Tax=Ktedonospora formicarum TaxID=2778364 RepID=A0A8J3MUG6_9CHLR|nr:hypothetical protein [Ktedonospora formicarum]GHO46603.1 hypothetical protein KSX_47660 [Ktedonospora formicarum]